jgi:hypothetical protein
MRYRKAITIPANTLLSAPHIEELMLARGVITEIELLFPHGQAGLVSVQIYHYEHQLYPTSPGAAFVGDGTHITIQDEYELSDDPPRLFLVGWSPGTSYDHTVYVDFTLERFRRRVSPLQITIPLPEGL